MTTEYYSNFLWWNYSKLLSIEFNDIHVFINEIGARTSGKEGLNERLKRNEEVILITSELNKKFETIYKTLGENFDIYYEEIPEELLFCSKWEAKGNNLA